MSLFWCFFFKPMSPSFLYPTNKWDIAGIATMARVQTATRQATQGQGRLLFAHRNYLRSNLRSQTPGDHLNCRENLQISIGKWPFHGKSPKCSWRFQTLGKSSISMGHLYHGELWNYQRVCTEGISMDSKSVSGRLGCVSPKSHRGGSRLWLVIGDTLG